MTPVEHIKLSARIRAAGLPSVIAFSDCQGRSAMLCGPGHQALVRLILQTAKGEIEILHEAGIPTGQATGSA